MCYYIYSPTIAQYISGFISGKTFGVSLWYGLASFHFYLVKVAYPIKYIRFTYWYIYRPHTFVMVVVVTATVQIVLPILEDYSGKSRGIVAVEHLYWCSVWSAINHRQTSCFIPFGVSTGKNAL